MANVVFLSDEQQKILRVPYGASSGISIKDLITEMSIAEISPLDISGDDIMSDTPDGKGHIGRHNERLLILSKAAIREVTARVMPFTNTWKFNVDTETNRELLLPEDYVDYKSVYADNGMELDVNTTSVGQRRDIELDDSTSIMAPSVFIRGNVLEVPFKLKGVLSLVYYTTHPEIVDLDSKIYFPNKLVPVLRSLIASNAFSSFTSGGREDRAQYFYKRYYAQLADFELSRNNLETFEHNNFQEGGWR
jgi:hypothetical protein